MKKIYILIVMLTQLSLVESSNAQCYTAPSGLWPTVTFIPTCSGAFQSIATDCWAGEYSNVNLVAGTTYTFRSSITTDYITVDNNGAAPLVGVVGVSGTAGITWTCTVSGTYRFYTHTSSTCGSATVDRTRSIRCAGAATAPANNLVCSATAITCGATLSGTTVNATNSGTGENGTCGTIQTMPGVWYVVAGNGQTMTASLCATAWDSKIAVFRGTNCSTLTCVGGVDDSGPACASTSASYSWPSVVGQNYYILVHGYNTNSAFSINLSCVATCPVPSNDLCANAPILNLGASNNQTHLGTGCGSTANLGTYKDVWVAFTVPCGGMNVAIDFCGSTPVHNNAYLNIFPDCSFTTFTGATTWDFTSCAGGNIRLYWNNVPAGTYYYPILIDPTWETNYVLNISGTPLYTPAVAPTSISGTTAVCAGQSTTLTLQGGSAGTNGVAQWFAGSCGSAVIGTGNSITVSPTVNTTYFVRYAGSCNTTACASVSVNVNSASTAPTLSGAGIICPNTTVNLVASGGIAGAGSQVAWYTGPNGTGTFLGFGNSFSFVPSASTIVYARREGTCNTTADASTSITIRDYVYAANNISSTNYCTDNSGWNHFYNGNNVILSVRGNLSSAGTVTALISDNSTYFTDLGNAGLCASNVNPGEAQFEMQRSWNVSYTGTLSGTYEVRYYFAPQERQDVIDAAAAFMTANPACSYSYKYNAGNSGWFWFKNNNVTYAAPSFDDNPNFALMTSTTTGTTFSGLNYLEISNITGFSGGSGAIVLEPSSVLPVELVSFSANCAGEGKVNVTWATASEHNSANFTVEKSRDGINWSVLATVQAAGNATQLINYSVDDNNAAAGANYYRLTQTDIDGASETFNIASANCGDKSTTTTIKVYPNPSDGDFYLDFTSEEIIGSSVITIADARGMEVYKMNVTVEKGNNVFHIENMEVAPGMYYIKVSNGTTTSSIVKHSLR